MSHAPTPAPAARVKTIGLQQSRMLKQLLDLSPSWAAYLDAGLCFRFMNRPFQRKLGLRESEVLGRHCTEVLGPLGNEAEGTGIFAALQGRRSALDIKPSTDSGNGWMSAELVPDLGRGGHVKGVFLTCQEINPAIDIDGRGLDEELTEVQSVPKIGIEQDTANRKLAEEALRRSEESLRQIFEGITDGLVLFSMTTNRVHIANRALCRMLCYSHEEICQLRPGDFLREEDRKSARETFQRHISADENFTAAVPFKRKDGTVMLGDISTSTVVVDEQAFLLGVIRDVTERRELEERRRSSERLEAIGEFAGGVAHDFNNILSVITSFGGFVRDSLETDTDPYCDMEQLLAAAKRGIALSRELLALGRRQIVQPRVLNINDMIADLEKTLRRVIGEDISFHTIFEPNLGLVEVDPGQIEQVFVNLAGNARDAMPNGGELTIETSNAEIDDSYLHGHAVPDGIAGSYVVLTFTDTGIGMDETTRSRIFEPFFTTKESRGRTGLGLSTVYGIVKQNGGFIWVRSEANEGTTFKVYLPRTKSVVTEGREAPITVDSLAAGDTILVVEDELPVRTAVGRILSEAGYRVLQAESGEAALQILETPGECVDLLLTDVVMPGMSGKDIAERAVRISPDLAVIYMSGYAGDAMIRQGVLEKNSTLLEKPFTQQSLLSKVREALSRVGE